MNTEFPRLRIGGDPDSIRGGLSQIANCAPVAALFGQEVLYSSAGWPENKRCLLDDAAADSLDIPDFESGNFFQGLMKQMDAIQEEWGAVDGELNYQGNPEHGLPAPRGADLHRHGNRARARPSRA